MSTCLYCFLYGVCCVLGNDIFYQASHCVDMSVLFPVGGCVVF